MDIDINQRFNEFCHTFITDKIAEEKTLNKKEKQIFKTKYAFIGRKSKLPFFKELLKYTEIITKFPKPELDQLTIHLINKIRGIYKHAQAEKTMLCNIDILTSIELKRFTICITKNTIEANSQWTKRLIKDLKKKFSETPLAKVILVCSSSLNTLDGHATHCKDINYVIANITKHSTYRVLFICSNNTRVGDILTLLGSYRGLSMDKRLPIILQYDEAHNAEEGIPSKRETIENILMDPFIERVVPCSASENPIHDDTNPLWQKRNLDKNAFDYTHISAIKSTSQEYSSLHDAIAVNFEDIEMHPEYKEYNTTAFNVLDFKKVDEFNYVSFIKQHTKAYEEEGCYCDEQIKIIVEDELKRDIERRRQLEFHPFMKGEKAGYNMGLNLLDNFYEIFNHGSQNKIFIPCEKNIHIIQTPNRVIFTYSLMKHAIEQQYTPILLGLFRGKINLMYKDSKSKTQEKEYADFSENGSEKELNEKIDEILRHLSTLHININVPIIIIGNYKPTGESITFVNFTYGSLRSVILIPGVSTTPETDYQTFCRANYMLTKFLEHDGQFVAPEKIICSYRKHIENALIIEKRNDERIDELKTNQTTDNSIIVLPSPNPQDNIGTTNNDNIATPVKIQIEDMEDDGILKLLEILKTERRTKEDMRHILVLINEGIKNNAISIIDKTGKFNAERCTLKVVRTYRKKSEEEVQGRKEKMGDNYKPHENDWRFSQYEANHNLNMPYLNYPQIEQWECQLYACNDRYVYDGFVNPKQRMWLSYRF
jgi:hypothetical protein